jgi:hypothetical protein
MLINLSNHKSENWEKSQKEAAIIEFGEIVDIEFPQINPEWDNAKIQELAKEYHNRILIELSNIAGKHNAVHLMGETVFCFVLANLLKKAGVKCVASTTKRNAKESNGIKTSSFEFVKFRKYF